MKTLLLANFDHGAGIRSVGCILQGDLIDDRCTVDEPPDGANVSPGERRVIKNRRVFTRAGVQSIDEFIPSNTQSFSGGVEVKTVPSFVLNLGHQNSFTLQGGGTRNPVPLGLLANHLRVRMLGYLTNQILTILFWHPVFGLNLFLGIDPRLKFLFITYQRHTVFHAKHLHSVVLNTFNNQGYTLSNTNAHGAQGEASIAAL